MSRSHWSFALPQRRPANINIFRWRNVAGGHLASWHRVIRIGPWGLYLFRYAPGHIDETRREAAS